MPTPNVGASRGPQNLAKNDALVKAARVTYHRNVANPKTEKLFSEYADYHKHPTNVLTHVIGIPLIVFHLVAMLDWVTLFSLGGVRVSLALVSYLATMAWYAGDYDVARVQFREARDNADSATAELAREMLQTHWGE